MLAITLLGSIFYILFKILEKFLKNNLTFISGDGTAQSPYVLE